MDIKNKIELYEQLFVRMEQDLRSPIYDLHGLLQEFMKMDLPDDSIFLLDLFESTIQNLLRNTENTFAFRDSITGPKPLQPVKFSEQKDLYQILMRYKEKAENKNLNFKYSIQNDNDNFFIDIAKFKIIVSNILDNAVKYTSQGEINIEISVTDTLRFLVQDNGSGLTWPAAGPGEAPAEQGPAGTDVNQYENTGLGLQLVQNLVQVLGGDLIIEDGKASGTAVTIKLPNFSSTSAETANPADKVQKSNKILIVEDNPVTQFFLETILTEEGYEVFIASDGEEALNENILAEVGIILLDIGLPKKNGIEVTKELMKNPRNADKTIIVLTAFASAADLGNYRDLPFAEILIKPIDNDVLLDIVRKYS